MINFDLQPHQKYYTTQYEELGFSLLYSDERWFSSTSSLYNELYDVYIYIYIYYVNQEREEIWRNFFPWSFTGNLSNYILTMFLSLHFHRVDELEQGNEFFPVCFQGDLSVLCLSFNFSGSLLDSLFWVSNMSTAIPFCFSFRSGGCMANKWTIPVMGWCNAFKQSFLSNFLRLLIAFPRQQFHLVVFNLNHMRRFSQICVVTSVAT